MSALRKGNSRQKKFSFHKKMNLNLKMGITKSTYLLTSEFPHLQNEAVKQDDLMPLLRQLYYDCSQKILGFVLHYLSLG